MLLRSLLLAAEHVPVSRENAIQKVRIAPLKNEPENEICRPRDNVNTHDRPDAPRHSDTSVMFVRQILCQAGRIVSLMNR